MSWLNDCDKAANALHKEKRQAFVDHMLKGEKLGKSADLAGISFDAANGIMRQQIEHHAYHTFNRKAK